MKKQWQYIIVDTTLQMNDTMWIDELNGRQGDGGRVVHFAIKDGTIGTGENAPLKPYSLENKRVRLEVRDAQDKVKVVSDAKVEDAAAGLVTMIIPRNLYLAPGETKAGYLSILPINDDYDDSDVTTVDIGFRVYENKVFATTGADEHFNGEIETMIKSAKSSLTKLGESLQEQANKTLGDLNEKSDVLGSKLDTQAGSYANLATLLKTLTTKIDENNVAVLTDDQTFTGNNVFKKVIDGLIKGQSIRYWNQNMAAQDWNDVNKILNQEALSVQMDFYSNSKVINNPSDNKFSLLITYKVTAALALQFDITFDNITNDIGDIFVRKVSSISTDPAFNKWVPLVNWGNNRQTLMPYIDKTTFTNFSMAQKPSYRIVNGIVYINGTVSVLKKLKSSRIDRYIVFNNLPFTVDGVAKKMIRTSDFGMAELTAEGSRITIRQQMKGDDFQDFTAASRFIIGEWSFPIK